MHPFTDQPSASVAALGEGPLLAAIRRWLGPASPRAPFGIGDDCAVVPAGRTAQLLTVDPVIYGEHFDDAVPARAAGEKLFKRNLSDIAAMGGQPRAAVVALALDPRVRLDWLAAFYRGLAHISRHYRVPIVGGDIARHRGGIIATLTLVGAAASSRVVTRSGARRGDLLAVTGRLGGSLRSRHHYRFRPRLDEGAWLAQHPAVRSMMDVSDGLAKDLFSLTPPHLFPALTGAQIPIRRGCDLRAALCDGEDYELLIVLDRDTDRTAFLQTWRRRFRHTPLSFIGTFCAATSRPVGALDLSAYHGFEHLR